VELPERGPQKGKVRARLAISLSLPSPPLSLSLSLSPRPHLLSRAKEKGGGRADALFNDKTRLAARILRSHARESGACFPPLSLSLSTGVNGVREDRVPRREGGGGFFHGAVKLSSRNKIAARNSKVNLSCGHA